MACLAAPNPPAGPGAHHPRSNRVLPGAMSAQDPRNPWKHGTGRFLTNQPTTRSSTATAAPCAAALSRSDGSAGTPTPARLVYARCAKVARQAGNTSVSGALR
eukprot:15188669-Heterocapsa_arctica.AAC.1